MTKALILTALIVLIYLYWKHQQNKTIAPKTDDIIERKDKAKSETFWDAEDLELSDEDNNSDHD